MQAATADTAEAEIALLATGFALGELDEGELRRLYDLLRRPGTDGAAAARTCWEVLGTTMDLRATLATRFQDELRLRLEARASTEALPPDAKPTFMERFLSSMGIERPGLRAVRIPLLPRRLPGRRWLLLILAASLIGTAVWMYHHPSRQARVAAVTAVVGRASADGQALTPGAAVGGRLVLVAGDGRLDLAWDEGHRAGLRGPATATVRAGGLSPLRGTAEISAAAAFVLGLPQGQVQAEAGAALAVEADEERLLVGCAAGTLRLNLADGRQMAVAVGQAADGRTVFPWLDQALAGSDGRWSIEVPAEATTWRLEAVFAPDGDDAVLRLDAFIGSGSAVELRPGRLVLIDEGRRSETALPGAPRLERRLVLTGRDDGVRLSIDEAAPQRAPFRRPPQRATLTGAGRVTGVRLRTGPARGS